MGAKPYQSYKDSGVEWIGDIPEHWEVKRVKNLLRESFGSVKCGPFGSDLKNDEMTSEGIPVFNQRVVIDNNFSDFQYNITDAKFEAMRPFEAFPGDILITTRGTIGKVCTIPKDAPRGILHPCVMRLQVDTRKVDCGWFVTFLRDENVFKSQLLVVSNATTIEVIYQNNLVSVFVPFPPLEEQKQIASFLDRETSKIDTLIEKQQQLINLLKEKRGSLISHTVTKGLNPNVQMKDSGVEWIGEIPEHWEVKRLRFLSSIDTGSKDTAMADENGAYPFYVRSQIIEKISSYSFDGPAVITAGDGAGVGKVFHLADGKFDVHQRCYVMHNFKSVTPEWCFYFVSTYFGPVVLAGTAKSTVESLRRWMLSDFELTAPPLEEQKQIESFLDRETSKIDTLIGKANQSIALLKERRSSLISAAVTGKIDVREAA